MVYYEDLFVNYGPQRFSADPNLLPARGYLVNLIWAHQKLNFKDGAYKVRYQGSPDLLVIERSGRALIGLNDHGAEWVCAWVQTDFGPHVKLHDYSGATPDTLETDDNSWVRVSVPPMSYAIWGPVGVEGGFAPQARRTVQEFQLDDDLGDSRGSAPGYGGQIRVGEYRTGGAIWVAADSVVKIWLCTDGERQAELRAAKPDVDGAKSLAHGHYSQAGHASNVMPVYLEFTAEREGYHQLSARIAGDTPSPTRAYIQVEYQAPATSEKF
jgi:alpha-amylase